MPGQIAFTVMLADPNSRAQSFVKAIRAALLTLYIPIKGFKPHSVPAHDVILIIFPTTGLNFCFVIFL
ncbi:hypothetical protein ES703_117434 [subsurface metagenome]